VAVVGQGVLGGLRVTELKDELGIFHATLAQLFFLLVCSIALFQTDFWRRLPVQAEEDRHHFRLFFTATTALILAQLILGATMRHQHAGLAIPDFPAAYGKLWPDTGPRAIARYNQNRLEVLAYNPITAAQVELQMVHRILALLIFAAVALGAWRAGRFLGWRHPLARFSALWFGLVLAQVFLGAFTIWTGKSADVATAHVACGALCLITGGLASLISFRLLAVPVTQALRVEKNEVTSLLASSSMTAE
jgi:cytochrome c oxidase assembly protein subunit 15